MACYFELLYAVQRSSFNLIKLAANISVGFEERGIQYIYNNKMD